MYLRYIYKLHDLHYPADNFTEAGFTLKLYADSLSWSSTSPLPNDSRAKDVPEWKRKEELYHQIINYFDKGKVSIHKAELIKLLLSWKLELFTIGILKQEFFTIFFKGDGNKMMG